MQHIEDRKDLAAACRYAGRLGFDEGIANHFSYVPEARDDGAFLLNRGGRMMRYAKASEVVLCDPDTGRDLDGDGEPDISGLNIHGAVHRHVPAAQAVFHVHSQYATALASTDKFRLPAIDQNGARFFERIVYDDDYGGIADDAEEGERIARAFGNDPSKRVMFMANHGAMIIGESIAEALDLLFYLERACRTYHTALMSGLPLKLIPDDVARHTAQQWQDYPMGWDLHLAEVRAMLDREEPEYAS